MCDNVDPANDGQPTTLFVTVGTTRFPATTQCGLMCPASWPHHPFSIYSVYTLHHSIRFDSFSHIHTCTFHTFPHSFRCGQWTAFHHHTHHTTIHTTGEYILHTTTPRRFHLMTNGQPMTMDNVCVCVCVDTYFSHYCCILRTLCTAIHSHCTSFHTTLHTAHHTLPLFTLSCLHLPLCTHATHSPPPHSATISNMPSCLAALFASALPRCSTASALCLDCLTAAARSFTATSACALCHLPALCTLLLSPYYHHYLVLGSPPFCLCLTHPPAAHHCTTLLTCLLVHTPPPARFLRLPAAHCTCLACLLTATPPARTTPLTRTRLTTTHTFCMTHHSLYSQLD